MSKDLRRLGRGLSALISDDVARFGGDSLRADGERDPTSVLHEIAVDRIRPNPRQPRKAFDDASIRKLAESIRERGALQPIIVRQQGGEYEIVAGERRWRAAKLAGLNTIPAIVRTVSDSEMLELALIENLQREDLNAVERARAYFEMKSRYNTSTESLAAKTGEDRATVANYLRLLDLPDDVLALVASNQLPMGQARALLGASGANVQSKLAAKIVAEGWSTRQVEKFVRETGDSKRGAPELKVRPAVGEIEQRLSEALGVRVRIREGRKRNSGRIVIDYYSLDDFERVSARLGVKPEPA